MAEVDARLARESQDYQFAKATYDQDRYDFEAARAAGRPTRERKGEAVAGAARCGRTSCSSRWRRRPPSGTRFSSSSTQFTGEVGKFQEQIAEMQQEQNRLRTPPRRPRAERR